MKIITRQSRQGALISINVTKMTKCNIGFCGIAQHCSDIVLFVVIWALPLEKLDLIHQSKFLKSQGMRQFQGH
jgi:hypothetical protein